MTVKQIRSEIAVLRNAQAKIDASAKIMADDLPALADEAMTASNAVEAVIDQEVKRIVRVRPKPSKPANPT